MVDVSKELVPVDIADSRPEQEELVILVAGGDFEAGNVAAVLAVKIGNYSG